MHQVSPSQIATARQCLRRWYYQSVLGFKQPDTAATRFGSDVHAALEYRLGQLRWDDDADPEVYSRAAPAFDALCHTYGIPDFAGVPKLIELDWSLPESDQLALPARGRIDLVLPALNAALDWKTTSDVRYIKTPEVLAEDPQVVLYTDALVKTGVLSLPSTFLHVYTVTRGKPRAQVVRTQVTAESLSLGRAKINETLLEMKPFVTQPPVPAEQVPANILACSDYGGCPHRFRCFPETQPKESDMSADDIKAKLAARRAAQTGVVNPPPVAQAAQPEPVVQQPLAQTQVDPPPCVAVSPAANRVLLLGCAPLKGSVGEPVLFDEWVLPLVKQAQGTLKVPYWGLAEYGKGKSAIVALVADAAARGEIPLTMVLDRRNGLADACVEVLLPYYSTVISKLG